MSNSNTFKVPSKTVMDTQEIKGSKFITTVSRAVNKLAAKEFIDSIRQKYIDATHNCYAYIAGNPYSTTDIGFGDDGEVPGTAGKPMLSVLQHKKIGEIVVVVTRYFGGTKLGTGGLVRAYTRSVQKALDKLILEEYHPLITVNISFDFQYENSVRQVLNIHNIQIAQSDYGQKVIFRIVLNESVYNQLMDDLNNTLSGNIKIEN